MFLYGPDVSREGVQRDILPIVEGTTVNTRYGMVRTDHILFIATGAFHVSKPSDLIPELQGRFPIRVELKSLTEAARWAAGFGVKLALEFHGGDAFCNCLDTALTLVEQCGEPNLGVCLDAFHFYKGPSKSEDLERLTPANVLHVQVCDVAGVPRELMTDADRVMPGDGDFRLEALIARLRTIGYSGAVSLELLNPMLWQMNAVQIVETGMRALERQFALV